jgi:hypothetical protein
MSTAHGHRRPARERSPVVGDATSPANAVSYEISDQPKHDFMSTDRTWRSPSIVAARTTIFEAGQFTEEELAAQKAKILTP